MVAHSSLTALDDTGGRERGAGARTACSTYGRKYVKATILGASGSRRREHGAATADAQMAER